MSMTEAQKRASLKYNQTKVDTIYVRIPRGEKDNIKKHAEAHGESVNEFVQRAIQETIKRDSQKSG